MGTVWGLCEGHVGCVGTMWGPCGGRVGTMWGPCEDHIRVMWEGDYGEFTVMVGTHEHNTVEHPLP